MFRRKLIPVWIGIILLSGIFLMGQRSECPWVEGISFPDNALELGIRVEIGKPFGVICTSDLEGLDLYLFDLGISDLTGLEYCSGLLGLTLSPAHRHRLRPRVGNCRRRWFVLRESPSRLLRCPP